MPEAGASTNPKRFMILSCFVHYLLCSVVNYDGRFEILELGLASVSGLNSFFKFRAVP
jgi:hypothetical protein